MKNIILALLICLASISVSATDSDMGSSNLVSSKNTINGKILDKLTGEPLAGAEVKLLGTETKTYTDFEGKFEIKEINPGAYIIMVGLISYQGVVENVLKEKDNISNITVKLKTVEK
jgi:hypothetical protein